MLDSHRASGRTGTPVRGAAWIQVVVLLATLAMPAGATGPGEIPFQRITLADGLSQETIYSIFQDREGFMWFGTLEGLNRFDGKSFEIFTHDEDDPGSLSHDWVRAVMQDRDGVLWVGTDGGLNRFDPASATFVSFRHDPTDPASLSDDQIRVLLETSDGTLWIGTEGGGLNRFDRATQTFSSFVHDPSNPASLSHNRVSSLSEDRQGGLWVGTDGGGLNRLDLGSGSLARNRHDPTTATSLSSDRVRSVFEDSTGALWVGTYDAGLNRLDRSTGHFEHFRHDPADVDSLGADRVRGIYEDTRGRLWIATNGGLNLRVPSEGGFHRYRNDPMDARSLSDDWVISIFEDRGGVLWIGTYGGLNRWNLAAGTFPRFQAASETSQGLSHSGVNAIHADVDGSLWVGTYGGLNHYDPARQTVRHFRHRPEEPNGLPDDRVMSLLVDSRGELWLGTMTGGLARFDRASGTFESFSNRPSDPNSLSANGVTCLAEDGRGTLWVGTYRGGLNSFDRSTGRFIRYRHDPLNSHSLSSDRVEALYADRSGVLWVGTNGGLNRLDLRTGRFSNYRNEPEDPHSLSSDTVWSILEDERGTLWIGTQDGGLNRWGAADRAAYRPVFEHYKKKDGLLSNLIYGVLADRQGSLWLSSNRGLSRFDPDTETFRHYDLSHGLQSLEFNGGAYHRSASDEMFFGGPDGFNAFFPERLPGNAHVPPVVITRLLKFNKPFDLGRPIAEIDEVELGFRDSVVAFDFAALDYTAPEKNRYMHMLEGFDEDWVDSGELRRATYTNLDPGEYVFRVKASNNEGMWNEEGASLKLAVAPPPWASWWAYALYGLTLVGAFVSHSRSQAKKRERAVELETTNRSLEQEIRERQKAESSLRKLSSAVEQSPASVMITDPLGRIEYVNPKFEEITGYTPAEVMGRLPTVLESVYSSREEFADIWRAVRAGNEWRGELHSRKKNGELFWEYASVSPIKAEDGAVTHVLAANEDITVRKEYEEKLLFKEHFDDLTKLPNRTLAFDRLGRAIVQRRAQGVVVAVICVDLDNFKIVNDTLGHATGDELLKETARRLEAACRDTDSVARLSGDEFLMILPDLGSVVEAEVAVARIMTSFKTPFNLEGRDIFITASVGIAAAPVDGDDPHILLRNADAAMHNAKEAGRASYRFFTPELNAQAGRRLVLEVNLRQALENNDELDLAYQPIVDTASAEVVGFEALLRWRDPELGPIAPGELVPIAEETGMIVALGKRVLEIACAQIQEWRTATDLPLRVAVNVSSRQFQENDLVRQVSQALRETGLPAEYLELELTESLLLEDSEKILETLRSLSELGVRLSLDDFGSGYSALSYLKRYPFDALKIDRAFIAGVAHAEDDAALVRAIIAMAQALGLEVVAEGVETREQLDFLRSTGCELVQGFYLRPPVGVEAMSEILKRQTAIPA